MPCDDRESVLPILAKKYQEQPIALGVTNTGNLVELLTSPKGRTWTLIITDPRGRTCLMATGEGWRPLLPRVLLGPET